MTAINVLAWRKAKRYQTKKRFMCCAVLASLFALAAVFSLRYYANHLLAYQIWRNDQLSSEIVQLEALAAEVNALNALQKMLLDKLSTVNHIHFVSHSLLRFFNELHHIVPEGVFLILLTRHQHKMHLSGHAESSHHLSQLMLHLSNHPCTLNPGIPEMRKAVSNQDDSDNVFNVDFSLKDC